MSKYSIIGLAAVLMAACVGPSGSAEEDRKEDGADGSPEEFRCLVVSVDEKIANEESVNVGSIYDIGDDGYPEQTEESLTVSLQTSNQSKLASGLLLTVGQDSVGAYGEEEVLALAEEEPAPEGEPQYFSVEGWHPDGPNAFKVRVFTQSRLGVLFVGLSPDWKKTCVENCVAGCMADSEGVDDAAEWCKVGCESNNPEDNRCSYRRVAVLDCRDIPAPDTFMY